MKLRRMQRSRIVQSLPFVVLVLAGINACSSDSDTSSGDNGGSGATGGASGAVGTAGHAGTTGTAGTVGHGGAGGTAAGGGSGGSTVVGGSGGTGGAGTAGSAGSAGHAGTGGAAGSSGSGGAGGEGGDDGAAGTGNSGVPSTATRPQITSEQAANDTILKYLAQAGSLVTPPAADNWDPTPGLGDVSTFVPTYTVGTGGTQATVQAAITAAVNGGGAARVYIKVLPGTYREQVCVPSAAPPITLYSTSADASQTIIVSGHYSGEAKASGSPANACNPSLTSLTFGTSGSATFAAYATGFQAKNLTFSNDFAEGALTNNVQAVALMTQADQLVFENVRALGNQDTLYVKSSTVDVKARAYFKNSYVEGDVDFIFGRGTMVFDGCTIQYVSARRGASNGGNFVAPSTDYRNPYGLLIIDSALTADAGTTAHTVALGRAWDEGLSSVALYAAAVTAAATPPATYPNGQALIRNSTLGAQIQAAPWEAAASSSRPFSSTDVVDAGGNYPANRLAEFDNTGAGNGE